MASFNYRGTTRNGKSVKGIKEAISRQAALAELTAGGIFVAELTQHTSRKRRFTLFSKKVNLSDTFFQLSLLLKSGIPLVEALHIIARTSRAKEAEILYDAAGKVSEGTKFSEALASQGDYFDSMYINLIKASEQVGRLADVLMDIASYEENKHKTTDKLKSAMVYPMVILIIGFLIIGVLLGFVVPKMQGIFSATGQELPNITKVLLFLADFVQNYGLIAALFVLICIFAFTYFYRTNMKLRMWADKRFYGVSLVAQSIVSRFAHILAFQLREGLPLSDALYHATQTVTNKYVYSVLSDAREQVQSGVKFSNAIKSAGIFPELFPAAVTTGESSGNMPDLLERVSQFYSKKIDSFTTTVLSLIEPVFIVFIGGIVGFVVIAIMLPLLSMSTMVG